MSDTPNPCHELTAAWCDECGDCVCPRESHMNSAECPLHGTPGGVVGDTIYHRVGWMRFVMFLIESGRFEMRTREVTNVVD
jgi:hypothetical protein